MSNPLSGLTHEEVQELIDNLEAKGLVKKTGEIRNGQPVYVATSVLN